MDENLEGFRLSPQQRRLWRLQQAEPDCLFKSWLVLRIQGRLDSDRLERAIDALVERHEILRTVFRFPEGMKLPLQVIMENGSVPLTEFEMDGAVQPEIEILLDRFLAHPLDLGQGPTLHLGRCSQSEELHFVMLSLPSLAVDHAALKCLAWELDLLYNGADGNGRFHEEPLQYADLSEWQNELLESEEMEAGKEYWEKRAVPAAAEMSVPFVDLQKMVGFKPQILTRFLEPETAAAMEAMKVSSNAFLLSCWAILLWRFTGVSELVVGTAFDGRKYEELETAVGLLVRALPVSIHCRGEMNSRQLAEEVQQTLTELEVWQEHFAWDEKGTETNGRLPSFPFGFEFHRPMQWESERNSVISIERCESLYERFDLRLSCVARPDLWRIELQFDANRLSENYVARMSDAFLALLHSAVTRPGAAISELGLLSETARDQFLSELNGSAVALPARCVHHMIEEQAARVGERVAVSYEGEDLSYGEFLRRAGLVAERLRRAGVGPESVVGLLGDRSLDLFVGLLGILRAGGAYLPLDPTLPEARLRYMLEKTQTEVMLCGGALVEELAKSGMRTVRLDFPSGGSSDDSRQGSNSEVSPENLAYVMFTSGSTGFPKAVAVEHRNLSNYVLGLCDRLDLEDDSAFATVTPLATDLGNTVIFAALASGGRLHVLSEERAADADALASYCRQHPIDGLKIVPSHLSALLSSERARDFLPRRWLVMGGEALNWELITRLRSLAGEARLLNHYGPTETTVGVTVYPVPEAADGAQTTVSLGRALPNARLYPTDRAGRLVPVGVPGELRVGGAAVSRGYLGAPRMTAERFCPDPWSTTADARLYRTGDLVRCRPDGNLDFLGRIDHQVKIRGFRVELGEIEASLAKSPAIEQAAVLLKERPKSGQQLVAYLVPDRRQALPVWSWLHLEREGRLEGRQRYELPNGMNIAHLNGGETQVLYREIFEQQTYLRHGIELKEGDCVFDVGAHIGLFSLLVGSLAREVEIYAFEPAPLAFETLKVNAELYGLNLRAFDCGLSDQSRLETFTFYPHASMQSGLHADAQQDRQVARALVLAEQTTDQPVLGERLDELLQERLESWAYSVPLRTLSDILRESAVERIDLLKINAQKSEAEVLAGLEPSHWPRIRQIVVDVHDLDGRLQQMTQLLETQGYEVSEERETVLGEIPQVTLFARRRSMPRVASPTTGETFRGVGPKWCSPQTLVSDVKEFVRTVLPEAMVPSAFVLLDALPRTAVGKMDRQALPEPQEEQQEREFQAPKTAVENALAKIWAEVLGLEKVGVHDNFFEIGGHSLLATQVVSRLRRTFGVELSLRYFLEAPTIAELAAGFEALRREGEMALVPAPVEPVPRDGDLPLSFAQQRLWFITQLDPLGVGYNLTLPTRFRGPIDLSAFRHTLREIVRRHEILRTVFQSRGGKPVQVIRPPEALNVALVDLSGLPSAVVMAQVRRLAVQEATRPFDLEQGPMLRAKLLVLEPEHHVGLFAMHHIVCDQWSGGLLLRELALLYEAFSSGKPSPLPELRLQYADFASWQQRWLTGEVLDNALHYWRQQLAGLPPLMQVAADRPRPAVQSQRGARHAILLRSPLSAELAALGRQQKTTLFTTLLAGFKALLRRHTGGDDICVGSVVTGRRHLETEDLIGFFVNTLVLRSQVEGELDFTELVGRVREVWLQADLHQDVPFERLVEALQVERSRQYTPLFQVAFNFHNTPRPQDLPAPEGLRFEDVTDSLEPAHFDLTLTLRGGEGGIYGGLEYSTDLFDPSTIARMANHLKVLLEKFAADPGRPIGEIDGLRAGERCQLLVEWNDDAAGIEPRGARVEELIAERVDAHPDALGIVSTKGSVSYRTLDQRANQLAHALRQLGVGPEQVVAVLGERTPELLVGILAVLKAGGAFLTLEVANPDQRLESLLRDSGTTLVLTLSSLAERISMPTVRILCLDADWPDVARQSASRPTPRGPVDSLAYVFYTSGSTGRPKGVLVPHRALTFYARWMRERCQLGGEDRVLQFASPAFDVLVEEVFPTWLGGGAVVQLPDKTLKSPPLLTEALGELGVTVMELPSAYWHEWCTLLANTDQRPARSLRLLLLGAEKPSPDHLVRWQRYGVPVLHVFGLTETTITSSVYELPAEQETVDLPIGRPAAGSRLFVLDRTAVPSPLGVPGELYIGGKGLARSYHGMPALTAARFVPDPWAEGQRLYRTGDLVHHRTDGHLEFLGRIDRQIKLRGIRLELGEVEAVLKDHPLLQDAAVAAQEDGEGSDQLVAYGVVAGGEEVSAAELRPWLLERLPDYMIPSVFVGLAEFPLLPNGKIDRMLLPAPGSASQAPSPPDVAGSATEQALAKIWSEVLGEESVGLDESFFELGGHSLLAIQIVSRIWETMSIKLDLFTIFDAPTVRELAALIENSAPETIKLPAISKRPSEVIQPPLSLAQQRLWFLAQLDPGSSAFNISGAARLMGGVDIPTFNRSLREMVRRHEILRTSFPMVGGEPKQMIQPGRWRLPVIDLAGLPESDAQRVARRLAATVAHRPFDLATGPLWQVLFLRLAPADHAVVYILHHILSDEWSMGVFARELSAIYEALHNNRPSPLPELSIQYGDFAYWQHCHLQGEVMEGQLAYWRHQLAGAPAVLELPTDRPRPPQQTVRGASVPLHLSRELSHRLDELKLRDGATHAMLFLATFQVLLGRYCAQGDISVGVPTAGRHHRETEGLIGFFINMLVIRTRITEQMSFHELLGQVRDTVLESQQHQDLPFEMLVHELKPERQLNRTPLFQVVMNLEELPDGEQGLALSGLEFAAFDSGGEIAKFDLTLSLAVRGGRFAGDLQYKTDLFDRTSILRMVGHFQGLLEEMVTWPQRSLADLPFLNSAEKHELTIERNDSHRGGLPALCVHQLIAHRARQCADSVAVVYGGSRLTYRTLERRAERLADLLQRRGVGPEAVVGIYLEASLEMVVAVLAVLKAGGGYLGLDPEWPAERLTFTLAETGATVVLTAGSSAANLSSEGLWVVDLEALETWGESRGEVSVDVAHPNNLAYLIYTSGSTGRPKAVMVEHRQLSAYLSGILERLRPPRGANFTLHQSLAVDAPVSYLFGALLTGGTLHLFRAEQAADADGIANYFERHTIDYFKTAPSHLAALRFARRAERLLPRRLLLVGGEAAHWEEMEALQKLHPGCSIVNHYGPSETTVGVLTYRCGALAEEGRSQTVPLGSPLPGAEVYLLDRSLRPVPRGVVGEIWIAGQSVTRGYLSRPGLTAQAFCPHPLTRRPGERIYRSGDLARIGGNGALEFLRRVDHQVKIRGYRIELGEIEAGLQEYRGVRSAAVQAWQAPAQDHRLVAYVVGEERDQDLEAELRAFLVKRLPEYMMPTVFVFERELPRTLQGKVDRRALAEPDWAGLQTGGAYVAPSSQLEQTLVSIWAEVLAVEQVGVEDDFFELGGHSLLATQIIARIRREFACEVPLRRLFESPTVRSLAVALEKAKEARSGFSIPTLARADRSAALPLSFAQLRLWVIDRLAPGHTIYNMPFAARVAGALDVGALGRAMTEIVRRHEVLRTVFRNVGAEPVQDIRPSAVVPLPMIDLSHLPVAEQLPLARGLVRGEGNRSFDLAQGPLLRVGLLRLGPQDHILTATLHHSIADGWSMGILSSELGILYDAFSNHRPSPLAELPLQYADYAVWQRGWLQGEVLEAELAYWKEKLSDLEPVLQLPTDRPHPAEQSYRGAQHGIAIAPPLAEGLRQLAQERGATLFMTVLAAFKALLFLYSRERDLCVGTPVAGRRTVEVEGLIGCFVNMLALRTTFSDQEGFGELLSQVREVALEADLRQDVPFEKLVEELQPERSRQYTPIFQVVFNFLNTQQPAATPALSKLELHGLEGGETTTPAHFDLTLSMGERGDGLMGSLEYCSALFDAPTIARMGEHFEVLLEAVVEDPDRPLSTLATLKRSELAQALVEWNDTAQDLPALLLHELFEQQVDRTPEAIAAACFEEQLSYRELDLRADGLATFLAHHGVDTGSLVGLLLERSIDLAITILGILKAGCAFVPLDADSPQQRLGYLLDDSGAKTLVTHNGLQERIAADGVRLFDLDVHREEIEGHRGTRPAVERTPDALAYVIYTSGSTGRPKGVMVAHRSLVNFTLEMAEKMQLGPQDRLLQFASPAFDVLIEELFPAWSRGATVVFAAQNFLASPAELGYLLAQMAISVVELPSAFWHQSLDQMEVLGVAPPATLRLLLLGSEIPSSDRLVVWRRFGIPVLFVFGLTETAVTSTVYRVPLQGELIAPPIGRPLGNTRLYILGRRGSPVPTGAIGELYIAGEGLARGYLGQPARTAQRFLPDELSGARGLPGGRLYRTGDRVRYRADGNLEFLGRLDSQVKVRGFRVELGEVGATLMEHSAVRDAVALLREDRADDARLVAYFCSSGEGKIVPEELRAFLVERLPAYMVPALFVELDQMPLTAHGKVDRRALPVPDAERPTLSEVFVAPRSTAEEQLAAIWAEVLGVEQVGVEDSFFELGGHSILAIQIVARVRETMGIDLDLFSLFDTPTIAELAVAVEGNRAVERDEVQEFEAALAALEDLSDEEAAELLREAEAESSE